MCPRDGGKLVEKEERSKKVKSVSSGLWWMGGGSGRDSGAGGMVDGERSPRFPASPMYPPSSYPPSPRVPVTPSEKSPLPRPEVKASGGEGGWKEIDLRDPEERRGSEGSVGGEGEVQGGIRMKELEVG